MDFLVRHFWQLLAMLLLLAASAFFSSAETALFALPKRRLGAFRRSKSRTRRLAERLMRDPGSTVITILFGNMTVNVLFYALATVLSFQIGPGATITFAVIMPLIVIIFGEVVPKNVAFAHAERWAPLTAPILFALHKTLLPIRWALTNLMIRPITRLMLGGGEQDSYATDRELHALVAGTERKGGISGDERALLHEVIQLGRLIVRDVMVPRVDVTGVDASAPREQFLKSVRENHLTKLPLFAGDLDHVLGLVYVRDVFLKPEAALGDLVREQRFVPELMPVDKLLEEFRHTRTQFAFVVDEYGGVAGIVTIEDIVEELVGEIGMDRAERSDLTSLAESTWRASGSLPMHEWAEQFGSDPSEGHSATLSGYVTGLIGRPAAVGDEVEIGDLTVTVKKIHKRRIASLHVLRTPRDLEGGTP